MSHFTMAVRKPEEVTMEGRYEVQVAGEFGGAYEFRSRHRLRRCAETAARYASVGGAHAEVLHKGRLIGSFSEGEEFPGEEPIDEDLEVPVPADDAGGEE